MPSIFRTIGEAWTFMWRQPALLSVGFWLLFVPYMLSDLFMAPYGEETNLELVFMAVQFGLVFIVLWGFASTLTVGRRLLQAKAGRLRTSFKAVQGQARGLIIPLFLTDIIRSCITLLWGLPLIGAVIVGLTITEGQRHDSMLEFVQANPWFPIVVVLLSLPPLVYLIQTSLAPMVIAYEKVMYRSALKRSRQLFNGRVLEGGFTIVALTCILWLASFAAALIVGRLLPSPWNLAMIPVTALLDTFAMILWTLSVTIVFKQFGGKAKAAKDDEL